MGILSLFQRENGALEHPPVSSLEPFERIARRARIKKAQIASDAAETDLLQRVADRTSVLAVQALEPTKPEKSHNTAAVGESQNTLSVDSYIVIPEPRRSDIRNILMKYNLVPTIYQGQECISLSDFIRVSRSISDIIAGWETYSIFLGDSTGATKVSCYTYEFQANNGSSVRLDDILSGRVLLESPIKYIGI